jgi:hypothetical protein
VARRDEGENEIAEGFGELCVGGGSVQPTKDDAHVRVKREERRVERGEGIICWILTGTAAGISRLRIA